MQPEHLNAKLSGNTAQAGEAEEAQNKQLLLREQIEEANSWAIQTQDCDKLLIEKRLKLAQLDAFRLTFEQELQSELAKVTHLKEELARERHCLDNDTELKRIEGQIHAATEEAAYLRDLVASLGIQNTYGNGPHGTNGGDKAQPKTSSHSPTLPSVPQPATTSSTTICNTSGTLPACPILQLCPTMGPAPLSAAWGGWRRQRWGLHLQTPRLPTSSPSCSPDSVGAVSAASLVALSSQTDVKATFPTTLGKPYLVPCSRSKRRKRDDQGTFVDTPRLATGVSALPNSHCVSAPPAGPGGVVGQPSSPSRLSAPASALPFAVPHSSSSTYPSKFQPAFPLPDPAVSSPSPPSRLCAPKPLAGRLPSSGPQWCSAKPALE
jgi:hypothetical protein